MKITLTQHAAGVIVCKVSDTLTDGELQLMERGIAKFLANGKCRIVVEFTPQVPEKGVEAVEKLLAPQTTLARKLGGDLRFIKPGKTETTDVAVQSMTGRGQSDPKDAAKLAELNQQIEQLNREVAHLRDRLEEALKTAGSPVTERELRESLEFYRKLAEAAEQVRESAVPAEEAPKK